MHTRPVRSRAATATAVPLPCSTNRPAVRPRTSTAEARSAPSILLPLVLATLVLASAAGPPSRVAASGPDATLNSASARPNFLWISLEDISPDLGCYGDTYAITPRIDQLATEGRRYTRAFAHAGVCAPSRSGIITGMYPTTIGTPHMRSQGVPPDEVRCFTEYLRAAGYFCTNDSKTDYNFASPLTAWDENRPGAHWRHRPDPGQPFFAVINLTSTHESQIRLAPEALARRRAALAEHERHNPTQAVLPPYYPDTPITRADWARYHDNLTFTDKQVGRILDDLRADGLAESTIVFFWGDHGRGLPRAKRWTYDSGIHVPLIVRWPGQLPAGSVSDELVALIDLAPTLLSLAGIDIPAHLQGQAFLGPRKPARPRDYIFAARDRMDEAYDTIRAVRDKRYKYIRNYRPELPYAQRIAYMDEMPTMREWRRLHAEGQLTGPTALFFASRKPDEELYDTQEDPHEVRNLASDPAHAETLRRLRDVHERWLIETRDLGLMPEAELQQRMRPDGQWRNTTAPEATFAAGRVTLRCETPGSSIAYRFSDQETTPPDNAGAEPSQRRDDGTSNGQGQVKKRRPNSRDRGQAQGAMDSSPPPHWLLYSGPIPIQPGQRIVTRACRLGYRDSPERAFVAPVR